MICPHCGRKSDPLFKFCLHCGRELDNRGKSPKQRPERKPVQEPEAAAPEAPAAPKPKEVTSPCPACGAAMKPSDRFCPSCGHPAGQPVGAPAAKPAAVQPPAAQEVAAPRATSMIPVLRPESGRAVVGSLVGVSSVDGHETIRLPIYAGENTLGRGAADIQYAEDDLLNPLHLTLEVVPEGVVLHCLGSRNGTFVRMVEPAYLEHMDLFRIGQQLLRYEELDRLPLLVSTDEPETQILGSPIRSAPWGRLTQVVDENLSGSSFLLSGDKVFLGRERGNITFPGDRYVSGTHAVVTRKESGTTLNDVGSSNGTYLQVKGSMMIRSGQFFLAGRQLFRLHLN